MQTDSLPEAPHVAEDKYFLSAALKIELGVQNTDLRRWIQVQYIFQLLKLAKEEGLCGV